MSKREKNPQKNKKSGFQRILLWSLFLVFLLVGAIVLYGLQLGKDVHKRFSGRRWTIPSTAYSDSTILYPGQAINPLLFKNKLKRLHYRPVAERPQHIGDMQLTEGAIRIFLHEFNKGGSLREAFPVEIGIDSNRISHLKRTDRNADLTLLELEPEELMQFFGFEREARKLVAIDDVPRHVIQAVLSAEDARYYDHAGMDPRAILRAFYTDLTHKEFRQGGSTITQQLAKNYFLTPEKTLRRKLKELMLSFTMEAMYGKDEILEIYLNEIYFGQKGSVSIHGIGEASWFYFGKSVKDVSLAEAATLAGIIRAPNHYFPYTKPGQCLARRNSVLAAMSEQGRISEEELAAASAEPLSPIPYQAYGRQAPYFLDFVAAQLKTLYSPNDLSGLGFSIYTTLDTQVQEAAENAMSRGLEEIEARHPALKDRSPDKRVQAAVLVMQPRTGYILAMIGGQNYGASQFNRSTQARRQPGSAFKPFIFLGALDRLTPASFLSNVSRTYTMDGKPWRPDNYAPIDADRVTMRTALAKSVNRAAVDLAMQIGIEKIAATAGRFGFSTPLAPYPSLALGAAEVIPLELGRAYCALAADGVLPQPLSLKEVTDENGKVLQQRHMDIEEVTSPGKAYIVTSMLRTAAEEGTARDLRRRGISFPVAAKTGTTNDFRDAWFVGYTPDILALVWVGLDDGDSIKETGAAAALPIWAELMKAIPQYTSGGWFEMPTEVTIRKICPTSGQLALPGACPNPKDEVFLAERVPTEPCGLHGKSKKPGIVERFINVFKNL